MTIQANTVWFEEICEIIYIKKSPGTWAGRPAVAGEKRRKKEKTVRLLFQGFGYDEVLVESRSGSQMGSSGG